MVMWFSSGFAAQTRLDVGCLRARAAQPTSHDSLFPTVLGLFDVDTTVRRHERDLVEPCRARGPA
jgi:lipid A ethanolaminephosphotransferase